MSKIPSLAGLVLKGSISFLIVSNLIIKKKILNNPKSHFSSFNIVQDKITHYSIIPVFHYSNCERSELTCSSFASLVGSKHNTTA